MKLLRIFQKTYIFLPLFFLALSQTIYAGVSPRDVANMNTEARRLGDAGRFRREATVRGTYYLVFENGPTPIWAINKVLDGLGATKGYGTGGIDPFKVYTHEEYRRSPIYHYAMYRGKVDTWDKNIGKGIACPGIFLIEGDLNLLGPNCYKDLQAWELKQAEKNEFFSDTIPRYLRLLKKPTNIALLFLLVLGCIGIPIVVWKSCGAFYTWLFARRPKIISEADTDIYTSWFGWATKKRFNLPKLIVDEVLGRRLDTIMSENRRLTRHNRNQYKKWRGKRTWQRYISMIGYGTAGTGKTLFGKHLAHFCGMNYVRTTIADFDQLGLEEAIEKWKEVLVWVKRQKALLFQIDEFDLLFQNNPKMKAMRVMYQKFFPDATSRNVLVYATTNYPDLIPIPVLSRLGEKIHFPAPTPETKRELFAEHLSRRRKLTKKYAKELASSLAEEDMIGLVGRDIQMIAIRFGRLKKTQLTVQSLKEIITKFRHEAEKISVYLMARQKYQKEKKRSKPKPIEKKHPPKPKPTLWGKLKGAG